MLAVSMPACRRLIAQVCRSVCGVTFFPVNEGHLSAAVAAGLVPFGTDDVQSTQFANKFTFRLHFFSKANFFHQLFPFVARYVEPSLILMLQLSPRHRFRVATQDDIGTPSGQYQLLVYVVWR